MTNFNPHDHEHDASGQCLDSDGNAHVPPMDNWRTTPWDVAGILISTATGVVYAAATALHQGAGILSREFIAHGNNVREARLERSKRRLLIDDLRSFEKDRES